MGFDLLIDLTAIIGGANINKLTGIYLYFLNTRYISLSTRTFLVQ